MRNILVVVDMQKDFIDGALGTPEAIAIVDQVADKIRHFTGDVIFTRDTHGTDYLHTAEGKKLPVPHCIRGTDGWQITPVLSRLRPDAPTLDKPTFGSVELGELLCRMHQANQIRTITLVGLCTDICVISNALLIKAFLPQVQVQVEAALCAGVTPKSHETALQAMAMCQIDVIE